MKAGERLQKSDLESISIPFSGTRATLSKADEEGETQSVTQTVTTEKAERVWVTKGEVDHYVGRQLLEDVESGDYLVHKLFASDSESAP